MTVRIVTDSTACLPPTLAEQLGITVVNIHVTHSDKDRTTAGLSALELVAAYARQLERGGDEGVLALHMSKEISSTWSAAVTAAGVFEDSRVRVLDTESLGPTIGIACIAAALKAREGADLDACYDAALEVLEHSEVWFYVHKIDELRKSGRLSAANVLFSATLAIRPLMHLKQGRIEIAAKTRTQAKALAKLAEVVELYCCEEPAVVTVLHHEARESARQLAIHIVERIHVDSTVRLDRLEPALATHTGPGTIAVSVTRGNPSAVIEALAVENEL
ncbi:MULTISPECIES: DegV family protein [Corynebacterium]|uniref:DegV family protein n=1 Tax=Corynebacterium TaxID=1716 RepID=UPI00124E000F|nr:MULTISPECIES: DegV family protein [Corynebacterium]